MLDMNVLTEKLIKCWLVPLNHKYNFVQSHSMECENKQSDLELYTIFIDNVFIVKTDADFYRLIFEKGYSSWFLGMFS